MVETNLKTCTKCGETKTLGMYHLDRTQKGDGHKFQCKKCALEYWQKYYAKNKGFANRRNQWSDFRGMTA